ncbi:O-antigen ligase family protein [Nocardioides humi]|uniref:O-antigen ligase n=1 Tax=Nocardioides humi TaxID=449461 RepID=A0ABN1ZT98_9ACTN|nr:O-antigen ligase family protein [Nocardioides humi]
MPNQTTARPPTAARGDGSTGVVERRAVTVFVVLLAMVLAAASARGPVMAAVGIGFAGFVAALAILGRQRIALLAMLGAFATAPMYKGLAPSPDTPITPTDLLFGIAVVLLLPTVIGRPVRLPLGYVIGILLILTTGILSTVFSPAPVISALQFVQWLVVLVGLVGLLAVWAPGWRTVDLLLWGYVAGHTLSVAYSPIGDSIAGRSVGLTHHPNAFGEAGVMAFAALMYLWRRGESVWYRLLVAGCAAAAVLSVVTSGSRAAAVVVAGLVIMVPFVERSAVKGFVLALTLAIGIVALPLLLDSAGDTSALSRLAGTGDALVADQARLNAQNFGIEMFLEHPVVGNGFAEAIYVHNVVLAVAASVGLVGLIGYLMVLFVMARPIIGTHPNRRIAYLAWAFIAITPTVPGLEDRTLWVPMAPVILLAMNMRRERDDGDDGPDTAEPRPAIPATPATETHR